jgi:hypothetical protein
MIEADPVQWLEGVTRAEAWRGRTRVLIGVSYLLGVIPVVLFGALLRSDGPGDLPIGAGLFLLGPLLTSAAWCVIDRDSADLRELLMWLASVRKTRSVRRLPDPVNKALDKAAAEASEMAARGAAPSDVLTLMRSAILDQLRFASRINLLVAWARFTPTVAWGVGSIVIAALWAVLLLAYGT